MCQALPPQRSPRRPFDRQPGKTPIGIKGGVTEQLVQLVDQALAQRWGQLLRINILAQFFLRCQGKAPPDVLGNGVLAVGWVQFGSQPCQVFEIAPAEP